jgi:hypothetical protein
MLRGATRLLLVAGAAAIGAAGAMALRADLLVAYGVGKALHAQRSAQPFELAGSVLHLDQAEVGDEGYWFNRAGFAGQAPLGMPLTAGSRITITGGDGRTHTLEVMEIAPVGGRLLKVADDSAPVRLVRVMARVVGATKASHDEPVRFYVEVEPPKPAPLRVAPQAALGGT